MYVISGITGQSDQYAALAVAQYCQKERRRKTPEQVTRGKMSQLGTRVSSVAVITSTARVHTKFRLLTSSSHASESVSDYSTNAYTIYMIITHGLPRTRQPSL
jgi:hypothetical protein